MRIKGKKVGRNSPCTCGSGKKFKNCCMEHEQEEQSKDLSYLQDAAKVSADRRSPSGAAALRRAFKKGAKI